MDYKSSYKAQTGNSQFDNKLGTEDCTGPGSGVVLEAIALPQGTWRQFFAVVLGSFKPQNRARQVANEPGKRH